MEPTSERVARTVPEVETAAPAARRPQTTGWSAWASLVPALGLTALALWLHWIWLRHAGALWRDEAAFVHIATLPTWREVWAMQALDHCPLLPFALVRGWVALGPGASDFGLRIGGAAIGAALLAALWFVGRTVHGRAPLLALALLATNLAVVRFTASLRGYGIGCVLSVLALALLWRVVQRPTWRRVGWAAVVAVASVQALYQNAFFLLAAGCGGMLVCALRRDWRTAGFVAGIGGVAALSLAPYVPLVGAAQEAYSLVKAGFDPAVAWAHLTAIAGFSWAGTIWVWCGLAAAAVAWAGVALVRGGRSDTRSAAIFGATALVVGVAGFGVFVDVADFPTQAWYYVPPLVFVAVCLEIVLGGAHRYVRAAFPVVAVAVGLAALVSGPGGLRLRQTNVDQVAARLEREAAAGDFILVHPWYVGITFARYYRGAAAWDTLPPMADHGLHRYDLFKARMHSPDPIGPTLAALARALQSGRRVWIVGMVPLGAPPVPLLPPPGAGAPAVSDEVYSQNWASQAGTLLSERTLDGALVVDPRGEAVNPFEQVPLLVCSGWRRAPGGW